jgi:hypothetical protein
MRASPRNLSILLANKLGSTVLVWAQTLSTSTHLWCQQCKSPLWGCPRSAGSWVGEKWAETPCSRLTVSTFLCPVPSIWTMWWLLPTCLPRYKDWQGLRKELQWPPMCSVCRPPWILVSGSMLLTRSCRAPVLLSVRTVFVQESPLYLSPVHPWLLTDLCHSYSCRPKICPQTSL